METDEGLSLKELCEEADVSERTVRYYMTQGLVPPAPRSGPGVRYPRAHLARLRLIRRWQEEFLPLEQIRKLLEPLSDAEIARLAAGPDAPSPGVLPRPEPPTPRSSAADYVKRVLGKAPATAQSAPPPSPLPSPSSPDGQARPDPTATSPEPARSQWERWVLDEDIELHVRRPLSHVKNRRLEQLLAEAKRILKPRP